MNAEPGAPDQPDRDGADERNAHPGGADETLGRYILDRSDRHEAHDDMRRPEIAEPPGRGRDNGECAGASEQAEHVRIDVAKNVADARALAEIGERDDGQGDERYHHDRALDEIGQADCKEADRKSVVEGKSVSVRVDFGGRRIIKKKKKINKTD